MRVPVIPDQVTLADAPPSSPEFIIKKPHDESRYRAKQWSSPDSSTAPRTTKMTTSEGTAKKRVFRTYSKRDSSTSTLASTPERAAKRQKSEPTSTAPLSATAEAPPKAEKKRKAHATIDGYFRASSDASSSTPSVSSGPTSSDSILTPDSDEPGRSRSLPSSPPARRWTSPRRLRFRPSLIPISGNEQEGHAPPSVEDSTGKRKRGNAMEEPEGPLARPTKSSRGDEEKGKDAAGRVEGQDLRPTGQDDVGMVERESANGLPDSTSGDGRPATPLPLDNPVPGYAMPYSYYLSSAHPRPSPLASTASKKHTRKIQTTLNLSTKLPFKECKLCDTVYNPLHAADVKLHQTMHARKLAASNKVNGGESEEGKRGIGKTRGRTKGLKL
ncbi:uncharacterized protein DNG_10311 [Cephalotrichum gorgonifer]|uniref:N-acetyltransferase ESCO zinc-finger domain-containing protein n=1 Tax=Cephalotrichum gorgonifer TaxID=2041049 RepID=A0AAE8N7E4_9PEZI|nr:uncharacterized protein DNG_10311 [Cephalotrichum gorgonifer]